MLQPRRSHAALNRHVAPAMLLVAAVALEIGSELPSVWYRLSLIAAGLALLLYLVGSILLISRSVAPVGRVWPDGLIVWAVALLPLAWVASLVPRAMVEQDYAFVGVMVWGMPALGLAAACVVVDVVLVLRMHRVHRRDEPSIATPDQG